MTSEGPRTNNNSYAETLTPGSRVELNSGTNLTVPSAVMGQPDGLVISLMTLKVSQLCVCVGGEGHS